MMGACGGIPIGAGMARRRAAMPSTSATRAGFQRMMFTGAIMRAGAYAERLLWSMRQVHPHTLVHRAVGC